MSAVQVVGLPCRLCKSTHCKYVTPKNPDAPIRCGVPVLDLRMICTEPGDYSEKSPIVPSSEGGAKLADRLVTAVLEHDFTKRGCRVYS